MRFVETSVFTRQAVALLDDDALRALQAALVERPDLGAVIPGGGGVRKVRWAGSGRGKRGGVRVIYYWFASEAVIFCLLCYAKNERDDLSRAQLAALRALVERAGV